MLTNKDFFADALDVSIPELADALIESAAITNSDEPLPVQPQILPLVPETDAPTEAEAEAAQPPLEEAAAQSASEEQQTQDELYADTPELEAPAVLLDSAYTGRDDVALYIHLYNRLPPNFITKTEAREFGWQGGSLEGIDGIPSGSCISSGAKPPSGRSMPPMSMSRLCGKWLVGEGVRRDEKAL